jgi:hypothetical protein
MAPLPPLDRGPGVNSEAYVPPGDGLSAGQVTTWGNGGRASPSELRAIRQGLLAIKGALGIAKLDPEFAVPKPEIIDLPSPVGGVEVVTSWGAPAEVQRATEAAEARLGEAGGVIITVCREPRAALPSDAGAPRDVKRDLGVPSSDRIAALQASAMADARTAALKEKIRLEQLLGPSALSGDAASAPYSDAAGAGHTSAPPPGTESPEARTAAEVAAQLAVYGPGGFHYHGNYGADGRCGVVPGCLYVAAQARARVLHLVRDDPAELVGDVPPLGRPGPEGAA